MAEPQRVQGALESHQDELCREFLAAALQRSAENLEMLLGQPLEIVTSKLDLEHDDSLRLRLPGSAVAFAVKGDAADGRMLVVIEPPLARVLEALIRMAPEEEVQRARQEEGNLDAGELESLLDVGNFLLAGLTDEATKRTRSKVELKPDGCLSLENSSWTSGEDPIRVGTYMVAEGTIKVGDDDPDPLLVAIPWEILRAVLDGLGDPGASSGTGAAPAASSAAARSGDATAPLSNVEAGDVVFVGPAEVHARMVTALDPAPVTHLEHLSHLLASLESGAYPAMITGFVAANRPGDLEILGALRRHSALSSCRFLVILDRPRRDTVMRCGGLRLLDALPADVDDALLRRRATSVLARVTPASARA